MRSSIFLCELCETFYTALSFFKTSNKYSDAEKGLIFIAQIDFWDFQIENLIYAFDSFQERQEDWINFNSIVDKIKKKDLIVRTEHLEKVKTARYWRNQNKPLNEPKDLLLKTVNLYNDLIDKYSYLLIDNKQRKQYTLVGIKVKHINEFKKKVPVFE
jgi:hypothetical protein